MVTGSYVAIAARLPGSVRDRRYSPVLVPGSGPSWGLTSANGRFNTRRSDPRCCAESAIPISSVSSVVKILLFSADSQKTKATNPLGPVAFVDSRKPDLRRVRHPPLFDSIERGPQCLGSSLCGCQRLLGGFRIRCYALSQLLAPNVGVIDVGSGMQSEVARRLLVRTIQFAQPAILLFRDAWHL